MSCMSERPFSLIMAHPLWGTPIFGYPRNTNRKSSAESSLAGKVVDADTGVADEDCACRVTRAHSPMTTQGNTVATMTAMIGSLAFDIQRLLCVSDYVAKLNRTSILERPADVSESEFALVELLSGASASVAATYCACLRRLRCDS